MDWAIIIFYLVMLLSTCGLTGLRVAQIQARGEDCFYKRNVNRIRTTTLVLGSILTMISGLVLAGGIYSMITEYDAIDHVRAWVGLLLLTASFVGHLINSVVACRCNGDLESSVYVEFVDYQD